MTGVPRVWETARLLSDLTSATTVLLVVISRRTLSRRTLLLRELRCTRAAATGLTALESVVAIDWRLALEALRRRSEVGQTLDQVVLFKLTADLVIVDTTQIKIFLALTSRRA